jgi:hypothetical protein
MAVSEDLRQVARESAWRLASMTPESSIRAAALLRDVKPRLATDQQRVAEEMARRFDERAAAQSPPSSS